MAVNINVPSQVKTYANLAAFPATGALKTIYIAEDTNKTYRWTGSVYTEISASAAMTWGAIGGTLSNQTDLQNALDAKVPTSRTLTINGVTQDLSANRTFTISTGITIGSTAIASGVVGRVLFEGAGNVVQESSSLFWDATNNRLGIGTSSPTQPIDVNGNGRIQGQLTTGGGSPLVLTGESFAFQTVVASGPGGSVFGTNGVNPSFIDILSGSNFWHFSNRSASGGGNNRFGIYNANFSGTTASYTSELFTIHTSGNVGIGTTTDAGFKLDVNGTARVQGNTTIVGTSLSSLTVSNGATTMINTASSGIAGSDFRFRLWTNNQAQTLDLYGSGDYDHQAKHGFRIGNTERLRIFNTGNVLIQNGGTFTDAGFRLDVNGTARVSGNATINGQLTTTTAFPTIRAHSANTTDSAGFQCATNNGSGNNASFLTYSASVGFGLGGNAGFGSSTSIIIFGNSSANSGGTTAIRLRPGGFDTPADALIAYQNSVSIGTTNIPVASAVLDVVSTTKGFLPPRMTTTQKNAIATPAAGLMVYDTTLNVISYYNGTMWI